MFYQNHVKTRISKVDIIHTFAIPDHQTNQ